MKARDLTGLPIIEWSPTTVRCWLPGSNKVVEAQSLEALKPHLGGANEVIVALSRRTSFVRTTRLPDAAKSEVAKILELQIGGLFPIAANEVSFDFALTGDKNAEGRLAVVGAVKSSTLEALKSELSAQGIQSAAIVPAALGSVMLARSLGKPECAVVEECPEGLAIDIISEGELRVSRVVPMPAPDMIDGEVCRSFAVAKLPLSPMNGGERGRGGEGPITIAAGGLAYPEADLSVGTPSLAGLSSGTPALNLELRDIVEKREKQRHGRTQRVALLLWVAALLLGAVLWDQRSTEAAVISKGDARWRKRLGTLTTTKNQAQAKLTSIQGMNTALDLGFEPSQRMSDVVRVVSSLAPEGLWLTGVTLERGKPLMLRGTAMNNEAVTRYLEALSGQSRFRDVKLVFANNGQIEKTNIVQFSLTAIVVGNLPLDSEVLKK
ncbi:MAG: PilN domain-containing protein [Fimbriimonadaceae bacterium]|nr:PilN domain-containing protein [Fimbriimonadaceae bacterium]